MRKIKMPNLTEKQWNGVAIAGSVVAFGATLLKSVAGSKVEDMKLDSKLNELVDKKLSEKGL